MKYLFSIILILFFSEYDSNSQHKSYNINNISSGDLKEIPVSKNNNLPGSENAIRLRELEINPVIQNTETIRVNDTIVLDLFNNAKYKACINKVTTDVNGTVTILGKIANCDYAYFIISTSYDKSFITMEVPGKNEFYVSGYIHETNKYYLLQTDRSKQGILEGGPPVTPPSDNQYTDPNQKKIGPAVLNPDKNAIISLEKPADRSGIVKDEIRQDTITLLIVYTPSASDWAEKNEGSINNTISSLMARSQLALDNSNTFLKLQLVHSEQVNYNELNSYADLDNLTYNDDSIMDNVHKLRDLHCADVVVLLENINFVGGLGWLLDSEEGDPRWGFSLSRVQQVSGMYTTIHEIGHNLGCHHHKLQNFSPGPGLYEYSAGWRWTGTDNGKYCSVMTYGSGFYFEDGIDHITVPFFSSPELQFQKVNTGDSTEADNARTIRQTKSILSGYRSGYISSPATPVAKVSTNIEQTSFTANWKTTPFAVGYSIDVATDIEFISYVPGYKNKSVNNVAATYVSGLSAKTSYYYRIRAFNAGGVSSNSEIIRVTTLTVPSSVPLGVKAVSCNDLITLTWRKSTGPDFLRYRLHWGIYKINSLIIDSTSNNISDTSKVFYSLKRGEKYYFYVMSENHDGQKSPLSNQATAIVKTGVIPGIRIKWDDVLICSNQGDSIKGYQWYNGNNIIPDAVKQYFVTNKNPGSYKVETTDMDGCRHYSDTISISEPNSISLYPNPASTGFTLRISNNIEGRAIVRILNSSGTKVMEFQDEIKNGAFVKEIPVARLETGTYIVQVIINHKDSFWSKIMIVK